jgi:thiol-disulfide isomerase/thioredoxin
MRMHSAWCLAGLFTVAGMCTPVDARQPAANAGDPVAPSPGPVSHSPLRLPENMAADPAEAKRWIQKSIDAARAAPRAWVTMRSESVRKDRGQPETTTKGAEVWEFVVEGSRWVARGPRYAFGADAEGLWYHWPRGQQWIRAPLSELDGVDVWDWARSVGVGDVGTLTLIDARLKPEASIEEIWSSVLSWWGVERGERDGRPGAWVYVEVKPGPRELRGVPRTLRAWIDEQTGRVLVQESDMTAVDSARANAVIGVAESPVPDWTTRRIILEYRELSGPIAEAEMGPKLSAEDQKVETIDREKYAERLAAEQLALLGSPAPELDLELLAGGRQKLSDLKGRVVVLDFWATWCGPCLAAMPKLQALSERFKDKPVTVLGVNTEPQLSREAIQRVLEGKQVTFGQMLGATPEMQEPFRVMGIPHLVVIDQQGVVRDIHVGASPELEQRLTKQIETLLAGGELATEETLKARRRQDLEDFEDRFGLLTKGLRDHPAGVEVQRVSRDQVVDERLRGSTAVRIDVDGQGSLSTVVASAASNRGARLVILPDDGAPVRRVRLASFPANNWLWGMAAVKLANGPHVLLGSRSGFSGESNQVSRLSLYDLTGKRVSTASVEAEWWRLTAVALRTPSGRDVIVLAVGEQSSMNRGVTEVNSRVNGRLIVMDLEGKILLTRMLGDQPSELIVLDPGGEGRPNRLMLVGNNSVERFSIDMTGW